MPYKTDASVGDFEKLQLALSEVLNKFGSVDNVLEAFGLADMPPAQRYGILFGCVVFALTITTVLALLTFGGSFRRMAEQLQTGESTIMTAAEARKQRALLLERLLEGRERMSRQYPDPPKTDKQTNLGQLLLNQAPDSPLSIEDNNDTTTSLDENTKPNSKKKKSATDEKIAKKERYIPPYYEENYVAAYRKCQDRPGGKTLSGRPEARYEAYARGFAGCGPYTSISYRRSYGRMYEAICCANHASDDKYTELFRTRPHDIIGKYVRLEALEVDRHLDELFRITSGQPEHDKSYDPLEIWGFWEEGPFQTKEEMRQSFVFQREQNEAGFSIVNSMTNRLWGVVLLRRDDPKNLTIQLEPPIVEPKNEGSKEQMEACFLLMDRLFALGYRRIQLSVDAQDSEKRKLCNRLGFTHEGILCKHMIIKEASRDSNIFGLLNSDWSRGARSALFQKLYGVTALRADQSNEKTEEEFDEQERVLKEQKRAEAAAAAAATKSKNV